MTADRLLQLVEGLSSPRILVVGDLILDRYIEGSANRVSPEAPVLVFDRKGERHLLGGACNVAANLVELGAETAVLGVMGSDEAGRRLVDLLGQEGIDTSPVVVDPRRPTTRKTRYVSQTAQVLRVDQEDRAPVDGEAEAAILACLAQRPFPWDAVLLSDYGKGVLTRSVIEAAVAAARSLGASVTDREMGQGEPVRRGGFVVVDPKGQDFSRYQGVDLITPNQREAELATGIAVRGPEDLERVAAELRRITGIPRATVTLGKDGIFFEGEGGKPCILPTEAKAVFDVTGAGDTVVAALTLARASGASLEDSLRFANVAAGITVGHFGTWAVSREEILLVLGQPGQGKVLSRSQAGSVAARLRTEGRRLVFTNGCFDLLHPGHTDYLAAARAYGDALMVAVNTDESVQRQGKGEDRPINDLESRMAVLAALQAVDYVLPFGEDTPEGLIREITPHVLVKGEDWRNKGVVGQDWVEAHGGQVVLVPLRPGCSTTSIVERIRAGAQPG